MGSRCRAAGADFDAEGLPEFARFEEVVEEAFRRCDATSDRSCQDLWRDLASAIRCLASNKFPEIEADDEFNHNNITPPIAELMQPPDALLLPVNRVGSTENDEPWDPTSDAGVDAYLQTHFALLREEMLQPLRDCVISFFRSHPQQITKLNQQFQNAVTSNFDAHNSQHFVYEQTRCVGFGFKNFSYKILVMRANFVKF